MTREQFLEGLSAGRIVAATHEQKAQATLLAESFGIALEWTRYDLNPPKSREGDHDNRGATTRTYAT